MKNTSRKRPDRPIRRTNRHVSEQAEFGSKQAEISVAGVSTQKRRISH
jgi:hypothetical protein